MKTLIFLNLAFIQSDFYVVFCNFMVLVFMLILSTVIIIIYFIVFYFSTFIVDHFYLFYSILLRFFSVLPQFMLCNFQNFIACILLS